MQLTAVTRAPLGSSLFHLRSPPASSPLSSRPTCTTTLTSFIGLAGNEKKGEESRLSGGVGKRRLPSPSGKSTPSTSLDEPSRGLEARKKRKRATPPGNDDDKLDGYVMFGDCTVMGVYAFVSGFMHLGVGWAADLTERLEKPLQHFLGADPMMALNNPLSTGAMLVASWLIVGSLTRAFSPANTQRSSYKALVCVGSTWAGSFALVVSALGLHASLTKGSFYEADLAFLLGSLTILTAWRVLYARVAGTGD